MLRAYGLDFLHRAELLIIQNFIKVHNNFIQQSTDMEGGIAIEERTARIGHTPPVHCYFCNEGKFPLYC